MGPSLADGLSRNRKTQSIRARPARSADLAKEYAARAATFRRLAGELKREEDKAALLAIAEDYEAEAERLGSLSSSPSPDGEGDHP